MIGAPVHDPSAIAVPVEVLDTNVDRCQIAADDLRTITREGTHMFSQRNGAVQKSSRPNGGFRFGGLGAAISR